MQKQRQTENKLRYTSQQSLHFYDLCFPFSIDSRSDDGTTSRLFLINMFSFIFRRILLTTEEIRDALVAQGGIDVKIIEMRQPLDTITHLVITTGRSLKHLRKMSDSIVQAVSTPFHFQCFISSSLVMQCNVM